MAKILLLDQGQYIDGIIPLYLGDDWTLTGKIVNQLPGGYGQDVSLAGLSATAYFPGGVTGQVALTNAAAGELSISVPASGTMAASGSVNPNGSAIYLVAQGATRQTFYTPDSPVAITDPTQFQTF
jgi:hypothetical protein